MRDNRGILWDKAVVFALEFDILWKSEVWSASLSKKWYKRLLSGTLET